MLTLACRRFFFACLLLCIAPVLQAQWAWKDKDGRRIFSDQPPPPSVPEKDILKWPAGAKLSTEPPAASQTPATPALTSAQSASAKNGGKDPELEKKLKEAQAKEAARKKSDDEKTAEAKKENCETAKRAKASLDTGLRVSTTNAKGEQEILSDAARSNEAKRLQEAINSNCN
jgi:hypothetical protein